MWFSGSRWGVYTGMNCIFYLFLLLFVQLAKNYNKDIKLGGFLLGISMGMIVVPIHFYFYLCQKGSSVTTVKDGHCL